MDRALAEAGIGMDQIDRIDVDKDVNSHLAQMSEKFQDSADQDSDKNIKVSVTLKNGAEILASASLDNDEQDAFQRVSDKIAQEILAHSAS
jgi:hypothetical protein